MPVKLKKKKSVTALLGMKGSLREINVFNNGYHFNDLFTLEHNYVSINKS